MEAIEVLGTWTNENTRSFKVFVEVIIRPYDHLEIQKCPCGYMHLLINGRTTWKSFDEMLVHMSKVFNIRIEEFKMPHGTEFEIDRHG